MSQEIEVNNLYASPLTQAGLAMSPVKCFQFLSDNGPVQNGPVCVWHPGTL